MSRASSRLNFWSVPPSSTSRAHRHRVVALQQRVEQLEDRDRLVGGVALGEVVALEQLGHGGRAREPEQLLHRHVEPLAVAAHLGALGVEHGERLALERLGVAVDLRRVELRAGGRAAARVAHARGVVADDQHHGVAEVLELAQLAQHDRVAEVDVRRGGVDPELDPQGAAPRPAGARGRPRAGRRRRSGEERACSRGEGPWPNARLPPPSEPVRRPTRSAPVPQAAAAPTQRIDPVHPPEASARCFLSMQEPSSPTIPPEPPQAGARHVRSTGAAARRAEAQAEEGCGCWWSWSGLGLLALVSTVFGMMMAVASDLPALENRKEYKRRQELRARGRRRQRPHRDRAPDREPKPDPAEPEPDLAEHQERGDRDRGPPLLPARGRRLQGHRPRVPPGHPPAGAPPRAARRSPSSS